MSANYSWLGHSYRRVLEHYSYSWSFNGRPKDKIANFPHSFEDKNDTTILLENGDYLPTYALLGFDKEIGECILILSQEKKNYIILTLSTYKQ